MLRRAAHTIIFLGADRTDRIDLGPGPEFKVLGQIHLSASDADELTVRLEKVLSTAKASNRSGNQRAGNQGGNAGARKSVIAGGKIGRRVWILWERAGTQGLDISAGVVDGLDREQLHDTLSFEAEPLTGLPAADSAIDGLHQDVAGDEGGDFRRFWITQVPTSVIADWQAILTPLGAKLAGVAHPGGLPRERWGELHHGIASHAAKPALAAAARTSGSPPRSGNGDRDDSAAELDDDWGGGDLERGLAVNDLAVDRGTDRGADRSMWGSM